MARITADANGRPAPAPRGTGLTAVSATSPLVLSLNGTVLSGSIDLSAIPPKVAVEQEGAAVGTQPAINLIDGANVDMTVADNPGSDRVDITVAAKTTVNTDYSTVATRSAVNFQGVGGSVVTVTDVPLGDYVDVHIESPAAADTVTDGTLPGLTPSAGSATEYSRADHTHGTPADSGGIGDLTEGRLPVMGASALEDSRVIQTDPTTILIRARETAAQDYAGLQIACPDVSRTTISAIQWFNGVDTSPSMVLDATSLAGAASVSLGDGDTAAVLATTGIMGTGQVAATIAQVSISAAGSIDGIAQVFLGTSGDLEDDCNVTLNAAGVAINTGGPVTVNGDEVVTANVLAALILRGTGNPEGAVAATQGTIYLDSTGGLGATLYVKEDGGTGNTGWVVK